MRRLRLAAGAALILVIVAGVLARAGMTRRWVEGLVGESRPVQLRVWDWWSPSTNEEYGRYFAAVEAGFEARNPDVDVVLQIVPFGTYVQKLSTAMVGDSPPDVFQSSVYWAEGFYQRGMLRPLNDLLEADGAAPGTPGHIGREAFLPPAWEPSATGTMAAATAAAEPLDEPPGVRVGSRGWTVGPERPAANSVVTVFPRRMAPPWRSARTQAASRLDCQPSKIGLFIPVGRSAVSMMSLAPNGQPSTGESGRPSRQRVVASSAARRAPSISRATNALTSGSRASIASMQRSRNSRGESRPSRNELARSRNRIKGCPPAGR